MVPIKTRDVSRETEPRIGKIKGAGAIFMRQEPFLEVSYLGFVDLVGAQEIKEIPRC